MGRPTKVAPITKAASDAEAAAKRRAMTAKRRVLGAKKTGHNAEQPR